MLPVRYPVLIIQPWVGQRTQAGVGLRPLIRSIISIASVESADLGQNFSSFLLNFFFDEHCNCNLKTFLLLLGSFLTCLSR